jgi:hypothetical protein
VQRFKEWFTLTRCVKVSVGKKGRPGKKGWLKRALVKFTNKRPFFSKTAIYYRRVEILSVGIEMPRRKLGTATAI